ncbi:MAG: HigA family addiction module antidote protein [Clostridiales bacterium]|nr:HigA family addiction module antidote protein [Clostridiales bacterium]
MYDYLIELPTVGEILRVEFIEPLGMTSCDLAKEIGVSPSSLEEILQDRRKLTPDTSQRLAKYFGVSEKYFLDMQNDIEIRKLKETMGDEIDKIQPIRDRTV